MSAQFARLLERARIENAERVDIRVTRSGGYAVMLARPNGSGGAAQAASNAEAWLYIARIADELDNPKPDQRGPAADKQISGDAR